MFTLFASVFNSSTDILLQHQRMRFMLRLGMEMTMKQLLQESCSNSQMRLLTGWTVMTPQLVSVDWLNRYDVTTGKC